MRLSLNQVTYAGGEISPRLLAREDLQKFRTAAKTVTNMICTPYGPLVKRPGSVFVAETKDSSKASRLLPFIFNESQAYVLEFGDQYVRFYTQGGRVESPPGTPVEVATPYLEAELSGIKFAQSADTLYLVHPNHKPRKLIRLSATSWTCNEFDFVDGPYLDENAITTLTITPSATTGSGITLTASSALFNADHVGSFWRIFHAPSTWGYCKVTGYTDSTHVTADVIVDFGGVTASYNWREGAFSTHRGWPRSIAFYEQRLYYGGNAYKPMTIWGSKSGAYDEFTPGVLDDDPVTYGFSDQRLNPILWMAGSRYLLIGTSGAERRAGQENVPITPTNISLNRQTSHGSADIQPAEIGESVLFVQRSGKKVREMSFKYEADQYVAPELSLLAEHMVRPGVVDIAYQPEPYGVLWHLLTTGQIAACTYLKEQQVAGWHRHITDGNYESIESIPVSGSDQTWVIVSRNIDGGTKRYVEYFEQEWFSDTHAQEDQFFVDCGLVYSGASATTITGLDHLDGKVVNILANGSVHPQKTVIGGSITLDYAVTKAAIGLPYTATVVTLPPVIATPAGTAQGKQKRKAKTSALIYDTNSLQIGANTINLRGDGDLMDTPPAPFTGFVEASNLGHDTDASLTFVHGEPTSFTLMGEVSNTDAHYD